MGTHLLSKPTISSLMSKTNIIFPRRSDQIKYEINKVGLKNFLDSTTLLRPPLLERIEYQKSLTNSPVILGFLQDWEEIVKGNTDLLKDVFLGGTNYSVDMLETSPFSILVSSEERSRVFDQSV